MALLGGFAIPIYRLGVVLDHSLPIIIAKTEKALRIGIASLGEALKHWHSLVVFFVVVILSGLFQGVLCRQREGTDDDADG